MTDDYLLVYKYDTIMESSKWLKEIPALNFPSDWNIQIVPPFGGAVIRFRVQSKGADISIYLDCYDRLGSVGQPYWEIYPCDGDTFRCGMNDTDELIKKIQEAIDNYGS